MWGSLFGWKTVAEIGLLEQKNVSETDKLEWKNVAGLVIIKITEIKIRRQVHVET